MSQQQVMINTTRDNVEELEYYIDIDEDLKFRVIEAIKTRLNRFARLGVVHEIEATELETRLRSIRKLFNELSWELEAFVSSTERREKQ